MKRHLNLMSPQARRIAIVHRARRRWACVLAAVFVALLPIGATRARSYYLVQQRRVAASLEYEPIRQLRTENTRMKEQMEAIGNSQRLLLSLAEEKPVVALIGLAGDAVAKQDGAVYVEQLELEQSLLTPDQSTVSALALEGAARDHGAIEQLVESLRLQGPFRNVEFSTKEETDDIGQHLHYFTIECLY